MKRVSDYIELKDFVPLFVIIPILAFYIFSLVSGVATPFVNGFSVDANERLYIGGETAISVYDDGELVNTVTEGIDRTYYFTIKDDKILVANLYFVYLLDTDGKVIERKADEQDVYEQLRYSVNKPVTSPNGNVYSMESPFGWTRIVKNGTETVYRQTPVSYVVKLLVFVLPICMFIYVGLTLKKIYERGNKTEKGLSIRDVIRRRDNTEGGF